MLDRRLSDSVATSRVFWREQMATKKSGGGSAKKESSSKVSSTAGAVLQRGKATPKQAKQLAASVLSQDETKGQGPKKPKKP